MATTTTNFGWDIPQSTDLVKDGATAIAALGQDIDTALVDLKGGTTGQVLAKASNTDLDFTWSSVDPLTILDAKGDLISATAADTPARLAVGANDTVLTADSSTSTGLKWAAVNAGALTSLASGSLSGSSVSITSISSGYQDLMLVIEDFYPATDEADLLIRVNSSSANYRNFYTRMIDATYGAAAGSSSAEFFEIVNIKNTDDSNVLIATFHNYADTTTFKRASGKNYYYLSNGGRLFAALEGLWRDTSAISSIQMSLDTGNFSGGTYTLYGVK